MGAFTILLQLLLIILIHYRGLGLHIGRFYRETFRGSLICAFLLSGICLLLNYLFPGTGNWSNLPLKLGLFTIDYLPTVRFVYDSAQH